MVFAAVSSAALVVGRADPIVNQNVPAVMDAGEAVYIIGSGSAYTANFGTNVVVGGTSSGNSLTIQLSSTVSGQNGSIGYGLSTDPSFGAANSALVTGSLSAWANSGTMTVGQYGSGNTLRIEAGGRVTSVVGAIGDGSSVAGSHFGNSNEVVIDGDGSRWNASADFYVGRNGSDNVLRLENGANLTSGGTLYVGGGTGSMLVPANGNAVTVDGVGSSLNAGEIILGLTGTGNTLAVSQGAALNVASGKLVVGSGAGGHHAAVRVDGGAQVTARELFAGWAGDHCSVVISGLGTAWTGSSVFLGYGSVDNTLRVENAARLSVGTLIVGYGLGGSNPNRGDYSVMTVSGRDSIVTIQSAAYIGYAGDHSSLEVVDGGLVLLNGGMAIDLIATGSDYLRLGGGYVAWLGDNTSAIAAMVGAGQIQVWSGSMWDTASSLNLIAQFFEADAAGETAAYELTGYHDLGGYTVLASAVPELNTFSLVLSTFLAVALWRARRGARASLTSFGRLWRGCRHFSTRFFRIPARFCLAASLAGLTSIAQAQTYTVVNTSSSGFGSLPDAINQANAGNYNTITIQSGLGTISLTSQMFVNAQVTIWGNGNTIDMNNSDRAFFVAAGDLSINNLIIQNGNATGGSGTWGGGGGAGLGGAIFVGGGTYLDGNGNVNFERPSYVTLNQVTFLNNSAVGGAGSHIAPSVSDMGGGGGGMGGEGASPFNQIGAYGGGGGGGLGNNATGGNANPEGSGDGQAGIFANGAGGGNGGAGFFGESGGYGGSDAGGGGGGYATVEDGTGGGGGGLGGENAGSFGASGGFGGGGGGSNYTIQEGTTHGGSGGFGGGGGGAASAGNGGFGGGGAYGDNEGGGSAGTGGFGAGDGGNPSGPNGGGGGLGAGGAIFAMAGANLTIIDSSFSGNSMAGGTGANGGSAVGADMFLGATVTLSVSGSMSVTNLGGAGNPNDPNISNHASDPNAQGGIIKQGTGTLVVNGSQNFYSGTTVVHQGTLMFGDGAAEIGTSIVIVGENDGDVASLVFGSGAGLALQGFPAQTDVAVQVGNLAGSSGTITIGTGAGSNGTSLGARQITGGLGNAAIIFNQQYDVSGTSSNYSFNTTLTGSLAVYQNGPGTTVFNPQYGSNTYTGGTFINGGVLAFGAENALPTGGTLNLNSGTLDNQGFNGEVASLNMLGGQITGSGTLTAGSYLIQSGTIMSVLAGTGSLTQGAYQVTVLGADNQYTGATFVNAGTLIQQGDNQTSGYTIYGGATLEIAGSDLTLNGALVNEDGVLVVSGENNTFDINVAGGELQATGSGLGGNVTLSNDGAMQLGADVNLNSLSWQKGSTVKLTLGAGITLATQSFLMGEGGTGSNTFVFQVGSNVQVGDSFTLVSFESLTGFVAGDFAFTANMAGFDGTFELGDEALGFTVNAVPEPKSASILLLSLGLLVLWGRKRKKIARPSIR